MCVGKNLSVPLATLEKTVFNQENLKTLQDVANIQDDKENKFKEDLLALTTRRTRVMLEEFNKLHNYILESKLFKILFYTTQPAHLITALSVLYVAYLVLPSDSQSSLSPTWMLIYLISFSTHFGTQIWMTFVSGLALFFNLPRHTFGDVQQILFPKYFLLNASMSLTTLAIFLRTKQNELMNFENAIQASGMFICFFVELIIYLYLTFPLLNLLSEKHEMEKQAGVGMEVGELSLGDLKNCPHYLSVHRKFRKLHTSIAMLNIITMACTILQLYYLSFKLCSI